jgi:hypothetical protein
MIREIACVVKTPYTAHVTTTVEPNQSIALSGTAERAWYVREYQTKDEESLRALYKSVFGRARPPEQLQWKLLSRSTEWPGKMVWVAVARATERVVGHYGGIPLHLRIDGRIYRAIHSVEAMADPNFRRQGILTELGSAAHSEWAGNGYIAVIGLPNDKWGTRNAVLGYVQLFPLAWLKFPLRLDRLLHRHMKPNLLASAARGPARAASDVWRRFSLRNGNSMGGVRVTSLYVFSQPGELQRLWSGIGDCYENCVVRSPEWLRWRYGQEPSSAFKLLSCSIAGRPTGLVAYRTVLAGNRITGYVADLLVAPADIISARALLKAALSDLEMAGAGSVMAATPPGSHAFRLLTRCGFRPVRASFTFEVVPLSDQIALDSLKDPATWHLSAGDFDIV